MSNFQNESVFFIGDSITADGSYIKYLRSHFENTKNNIFFMKEGLNINREILLFMIKKRKLSYKSKLINFINYVPILCESL